MKKVLILLAAAVFAVSAMAEDAPGAFDPDQPAVEAKEEKAPAAPTATEIARTSPSPALLRAIADDAERGVDVSALMSVLAVPGGAMVGVDAAATKEERGHFKRNWGWYALSAAGAGGLAYAAKRDFWQGDDAPVAAATPTVQTQVGGPQIGVNSGDNSPVTITINQMPPE